MCAAGQLAIDVRGLELLQARPGETFDDAWNRMKGRLGTGKHLDETKLYTPDAVVASGGRTPVSTQNLTGTTTPTNGCVPGQSVPVTPTTAATDAVQANLFGDTDRCRNAKHRNPTRRRPLPA